MYRDGEEGHIGGDMEFNNRRNVFAHNESQVVIDYLSKHYCNLSFLQLKKNSIKTLHTKYIDIIQTMFS